jgi:hypothetical protein
VGQCEAGWVGLKRDFKWKTDFEIQLNSDFGKTLRNSIRRFRRNLDMRIFPEFFLASQGFFEITIYHAMNATLGQIKLRKPFP